MRTRLARVITRMNVGGPARHVTILATQAGREWNGVLITGTPDEREGTLESAAIERGAHVISVPSLQRRPSPIRDLRALVALVRLFRRLRPQVVATHTAKAGALGRIAALLAGAPVRVHTFHGHVLEGYFSRSGSAVVRMTERLLAKVTTHFVAISPQIAADLQKIGIGSDKITIVRLGLELDYLVDPPRGVLRRELSIPSAAPIIAIVGRLAPIKAHPLLFDAAPEVLRAFPDARFLVVGDGELWAELHDEVTARGLGSSVVFTGWRHDLPNVYGDADVVVCCSLNEGTPVSIIEAGAAGRPAIGTAVGGMPDIISDGVNGLLVPSQDPPALAAAIRRILSDPELAGAMGAAGRRMSLERHGAQRMVQELTELYTRLLTKRGLVPA
jgi:glycosyltransferase involved in cell wall biosynthesis